MLAQLKQNNTNPIFITLDPPSASDIQIDLKPPSNNISRFLVEDVQVEKICSDQVTVEDASEEEPVEEKPVEIAEQPVETTSIQKSVEPTVITTLDKIRFGVIKNLMSTLVKTNFNQMFMSCYSTPYAFNKIISSNNVCIVGNSPNMLGKGKGQVIDKYHTVIRFTDFRTVGFEKDVGSKVNIWITGGAKQTQVKKRTLPPNVVQLYLSPGQYTVQTMSQFIIKNLQMSPRGFIFYKDIKFMKLIMKAFGIYPSTGLATIFILIAKFGKVDTIGFDFYQNGIHYYNNKFVANSEHNWRKEYEIYQDLIRLGYVRNILTIDS